MSSAAPRLLLADDYDDVAEMWAMFLRLRGFDVITARDGQSAVEIASNVGVDAVILDVMLPGLSGFEVAHKLRSSPRTASTPLIAATGWAPVGPNDVKAIRVFDAWLTKPIEAERLVEQIECVLGPRGARSALPAPFGFVAADAVPAI